MKSISVRTLIIYNLKVILPVLEMGDLFVSDNFMRYVGIYMM